MNSILHSIISVVGTRSTCSCGATFDRDSGALAESAQVDHAVAVYGIRKVHTNRVGINSYAITTPGDAR